MSPRITTAIAIALLFLAAAAGLRYAEGAGLMGADGARRALQILIGLGLAGYANLMPKRISGAPRSPLVERRTQAALRVGGWSLTLAGLTQAGLWAFAPLAVADPGSMIAVASALALTLGYALWAFAACRRVPDVPTAR